MPVTYIRRVDKDYINVEKMIGNKIKKKLGVDISQTKISKVIAQIVKKKPIIVKKSKNRVCIS